MSIDPYRVTDRPFIDESCADLLDRVVEPELREMQSLLDPLPDQACLIGERDRFILFRQSCLELL